METLDQHTFLIIYECLEGSVAEKKKKEWRLLITAEKYECQLNKSDTEKRFQ